MAFTRLAQVELGVDCPQSKLMNDSPHPLAGHMPICTLQLPGNLAVAVECFLTKHCQNELQILKIGVTTPV
ncbi:hypothetical protein SAMN05920897_1079 [Alkalispirochaeta americana]|uniref:Uncharacterized protein n=1 Tax=Alkalispirochaeta americana TaxID=159291 RepID=A0A1N6RTE2_9SPIO|nr:hypothetical protein SAMN05920897_1079 [Alkalispirochaeta americana]